MAYVCMVCCSAIKPVIYTDGEIEVAELRWRPSEGRGSTGAVHKQVMVGSLAAEIARTNWLCSLNSRELTNIRVANAAQYYICGSAPCVVTKLKGSGKFDFALCWQIYF